MEIKVHLLSASKPIILENVSNTYTKDGLFCVLIKDENKVFKYPLCNIFNIEEPYDSEKPKKTGNGIIAQKYEKNIRQCN